MQDPIIILGPGRCGSTLLQRVLNTSEEITIWGEHSGFLRGISASYFELMYDQAIQKCCYAKNLDPAIVVGSLSNPDLSIEWINAFNQQIVREEYKKFIINLLNYSFDMENIRWGFKEIRYTNKDKTVNLLLDLFPESFFIFSIREPFATMRSMVLSWEESALESEDIDLIKDKILVMADRWNTSMSSIKFWMENKKLSYMVIKYEDLVKSPEKEINQMFKKLKVKVPETALKPLSKAPRSSSNKPHKLLVSEAVNSLQEDIWKIVGNSAKYFQYKFNI